jgi:DNA repair protein RecN (Recombination protein N)
LAQEQLALAQQGVDQALDALAFGTHELEDTEERLFAIRALARKHAVHPDGLGAFANTLRDKIQALDQGADNLSGLKAQLNADRSKYDAMAARLSEKRARAAKNLDRAMAVELVPLKMERAVFTTKITKTAESATGSDDVVFTIATNPGAPSGPLNKIASGGELSRFLLALKVCLTANTAGLTMIFDEIDRGVGGATADAVGRRLEDLARDAQILVVTHSPQVAARGQHHWRVEKRVENGQTLSGVSALDTQERVDEIARMLSGDTVTEVAREAARSLLAD